MKLHRKFLSLLMAGVLTFASPASMIGQAYADSLSTDAVIESETDSPSEVVDVEANDDVALDETSNVSDGEETESLDESEEELNDAAEAPSSAAPSRAPRRVAPLWNPAPALSGLPDTRAVGIRIDLFDYDLQEVGNASNPPDQQINRSPYIQGILPFRFYVGGQSGNTINGYTGGSNNDRAWPLQGILRDKLENGWPVIADGVGNGAGFSLQYLFDPGFQVADKHSYTNVAGLFQKDEYNKYYYDSNSNYAFYDINQGNGGNFTLHSDTYRKSGNTTYNIGFFPFDRWTSGSNDQVSPGNKNHHFGLHMTGDFTIPEGGKVKGRDMVFTFSGDDDAWLFIDDVLVLDIGGIHQPVQGSVNFATGRIQIGGDNYLNREAGYETVSGSQSYIIGLGSEDRHGNSISGGVTLKDVMQHAKGDAWVAENMHQNEQGDWVLNDYSAHKLSFFYLERGSHDSNLKLEMNLSFTKTTDLSIEKAWSDGNERHASDSVAVQLYQSRFADGVYGEPSALRSPVTLNAEGNWRYTFNNLPVIDEDGHEVHYLVREGTMSNGVFTPNDSLVSASGDDYEMTEIAYNYQGGAKGGQADSYSPGQNGSSWVDHYFTCGNDNPSTGLARLTNSPLPKPDVQIKKVDSDDETALPGAVFALYKANNDWAKGDQVEQVTTGDNDQLGLAKFEGLSNGKYVLEEVKSPTGYEASNVSWRLEVSGSELVSFKDSDGNDVSPQDGFYVIANNKLKTNLSILKVEKGKAIGIKGAKFALYGDEAFSTKIAEVETGTDGKASFTGLTKGTYWLKETAAPTGYQLLSSTIQIEVIETTEGTKVKFYNDDSLTKDVDPTTRTVEMKVEDEANPDLPISGSGGRGGLLSLGVSLLTFSGALALAIYLNERKGLI